MLNTGRQANPLAKEISDSKNSIERGQFKGRPYRVNLKGGAVGQ